MTSLFLMSVLIQERKTQLVKRLVLNFNYYTSCFITPFNRIRPLTYRNIDGACSILRAPARTETKLYMIVLVLSAPTHFKQVLTFIKSKSYDMTGACRGFSNGAKNCRARSARKIS